jgi:5'-methylthioadenosine phosphorylase
MPKVAVIGGSLAYKLMAAGSISGKGLGPQETPFGDSAPVHEVGQGPEGFFFLSRHGERGYHTAPSFINYRANIWALKSLGVEQILAWSGPGAINRKMRPGAVVVVDDLVDETRRRAGTFYEHGGLGFIRQWPVFCETCRTALIESCKALSLLLHEGGTYACTEGPRLETPAEIRKLAGFGCDLVGMTLAPEVFLARELQMCYAAVCYVTNFAEGIAGRDYQPGLRFEGMTTAGEDAAIEATAERLPDVVRRAARALHLGGKRDCPCSQAMSRYHRRGDIGSDWRKWIEPGGGAR